ncbi:MAG: class I SAM-dependent methyltransferase, partial [Acidobacteriota bacterium]|nr:class I SAM-dependent methyltransferase [Acidobacteriota bacterium]
MPPQTPGDPPVLAACPLCGQASLTYQFTHLTTAIVRCRECGLLMRNPQPSEAELAAIYGDSYFLGAGARQASIAETDRLKRATAARHLDAVESRMAADWRRGLRLLELGCGRGNLLVEARARGYEVTGVDYSESSVRTTNEKLGADVARQGTLRSSRMPDQAFDVVVMADVLEHTRQPLEELCEVWRVLRPGGWLFLAVPSLDSWSAQLLRERWMEFKLEHMYFFDRRTLSSILFRAGFHEVSITAGWKTLSADYVIEHFVRFPVPLLSPLAGLVRRLAPPVLRRRHVNVIASGIDVTARRSPHTPPSQRRARLTVIMPVYNEQPTFRRVFD